MARTTKADQAALARALKQERDRLVYLSRKGGWFWVEALGNRVIYTGPFRDEKAALRDMRKAGLGPLYSKNIKKEPPSE